MDSEVEFGTSSILVIFENERIVMFLMSVVFGQKFSTVNCILYG